MAADKKIMAEIEKLRLDRPGRAVKAADMAGCDAEVIGPQLIEALRELAATYREEAELWSRSGAKGWKSKETELYAVDAHVTTVAAQLDNAGGGAALSVSDATLDAELHEASQRIGAMVKIGGVVGLDQLIADSHAQRRGHVRDELLPEGHPARSDAPVPYDGGAVTIIDGDVAAYLSGAVDTLPGLDAALVPSSVHDMTAPENDLGVFGVDDVTTGDLSAEAAAQGLTLDTVATAATGEPVFMPKTWESETMTADGLRVPGATKAPLLGQPGDMSAGYTHTYVPPGGRVLRFDELLTPVPFTALPPHLSHSQIGDVGDCGVQYRLQRVEQLPQVPQWANVGGSAFHAAVETIEREIVAALNRGPNELLDSSVRDVETAWRTAFERQIAIVSAGSPVPVSVWRAARKGAEGRAWWEVNGPLMLQRYLDKRPNEPTASLPADPRAINGAVDPFQLAIEIEITVDVPTPYGPIPFKAQIDRVTNGPQDDSNWITLVIRDYKSSYERPTDTTQLGDYAHALRLWGVPESVRIMGTYFDARRGEWTEPVDLLATHPFEAFQYRVTAAHGQKRALTVGPTPARPSSYCGGCSVRYACPIMNQLAAVAPPAQPPVPVLS